MSDVQISKWFTNFKVIVSLTILCLLIYSNSFGNNFIADDFHQIVDNTAIHSLSNIPGYFTGSTFYTGSAELSGNYYKPLLTTAYSLLYILFGANATGYHILQVLLHTANAILLFFVFKNYFNRVAAFLLAVIFLVHPINNESVVYIANLQDTLFLFFGLLALVINITYSFLFKPFIVGLLLLMSLLSKETGLLFLAVIPLASILSNQRNWLRDVLLCGIVFGVYCFLRFYIAEIYFNNLITAPIMKLPFEERLLHIPGIIFFYIKTFFFPIDLIVFQTYTIKSIDFANFYLPLIVDILFFIGLVVMSRVIYKNAKHYFKAYIFFFVWFLLGLLLHLQVFPLDATVADRWFYFPIIGLLGMLAVIITVTSKHTQNWGASMHSASITMLIVIVCIFALRDMVRNTNWKDQATLTSHDIQINKESYQLEEGYGLELMKQGKLKDAYPHLIKSTELFPTVNNLTSLGVYYGNTKQFDKAKSTFEQAMKYDESVITYENYALLLFLNNDIKKTEEFATAGIQKFPQSYKLWTYLAMSAYGLGNDEEALKAAQNAYSLKPDSTRKYIMDAIKNKQRIDTSKL